MIKETTIATTTIATPLLDQKIDMITAGLTPSYGRNLRRLPNHQNISTIIQYIQAMRTEINLSDHYRKDVIELLTRFCNFTHHKTFKNITRENIFDFLDKLRKPESIDPLHKWIGTYNQYRMHLFRFVKWLHAPTTEYKKGTAPPILENIPHLKRKEISNYKPSDLWTQEDDLLFLKFCPSLREKCYHAMSRDLSCKPSRY